MGHVAKLAQALNRLKLRDYAVLDACVCRGMAEMTAERATDWRSICRLVSCLAEMEVPDIRFFEAVVREAPFVELPLQDVIRVAARVNKLKEFAHSRKNRSTSLTDAEVQELENTIEDIQERLSGGRTQIIGKTMNKVHRILSALDGCTIDSNSQSYTLTNGAMDLLKQLWEERVSSPP
jgi:hypothetical protein